MKPNGKMITWENSQWNCDPFYIELFCVIDEQKNPVHINPEKIIIQDTMDWFEIDGKPEMISEYKWRINIRVRESKVEEIVPEDYQSGTWKKPNYTIGNAKADSPKGIDISTVLTVTVEILTAANLVGTTMGAATGMGAAGAFASRNTPLRVSSKPIEYIVQTPKAIWVVDQEDPIALTGNNLIEKATISSRLPIGWDSGLIVTCSLPPEDSDKLGLKITKITDIKSEPGELKAELEIQNSVLCMRKVPIIEDKPTNFFSISINVSTENEYLGTQLHNFPINIQPVDLSIYLEDKPAEEYISTSLPTIIIRKATKGVPSRSCLAVTLKHIKDLDPNFSIIRWKLPDDQLQDYFTGQQSSEKLANTSEPNVQYIAPQEEIWIDNGKPEERDIFCLVGPHDEENPIDFKTDTSNDKKANLYSTLQLESKIKLKEPLGFGTIAVTVRPQNLPEKDAMYLYKQDVYDYFNRFFTIEIDLQAILDKEGEE